MNIIVLGHGGGVPIAPYGKAGNTNYAIVPGKIDHRCETVEDILDLHPYWLVDCGPETMMRIGGTGVANIPDPRITNLKGIIVTHCHGDHTGGLASLAWRLKFVEKVQPALIYREELIPFLNQQLVENTYVSEGRIPWTSFWETRAYSPSRLGMDLGGFKISLFEVDHNIPGFPSFGVEIGQGNRRVVISGDTAYPLSKRHLEADAIFHDVQFYSDNLKDAVHCPYKALEAAVPLEKRGRVWLAHTNQELPEYASESGFQWASMDTVISL